MNSQNNNGNGKIQSWSFTNQSGQPVSSGASFDRPNNESSTRSWRLTKLVATTIVFIGFYYLIGLLQMYQERLPIDPPPPVFINSNHFRRFVQIGPTRDPEPICKPHDQLVFIKTHKTGSTTLQVVVQIYGYYHNSSFVINKNNKDNGHIGYIHIDISKLLPPLNVNRSAYEVYRNNFDMSAGHFKYNRTFLDMVMKNTTEYISLLRDPVHQFESAFVFFGHAKQGKGSTEEQINQWLCSSTKGESYLNNNQMLDLGLPAKDFRNQSAVAIHIERLSREFDLMLITEYFDESLLLLRKLMCWSFDDILYIKQNARTNKTHSKLFSESTQDKIRKWNVADKTLYDHFNQTLWNKIDTYGPSFHRDLQYFRKKQNELYNSCVGNTTAQKINTKTSRTRYMLSNTSDYCTLMSNNNHNTFKRLWAKQI